MASAKHRLPIVTAFPWLKLFAITISLSAGLAVFMYDHGLAIHDNTGRSADNEMSIRVLRGSTVATGKQLERLVTIQEAQGKRLERLDVKMDRVVGLLLKRK